MFEIQAVIFGDIKSSFLSNILTRKELTDCFNIGNLYHNTADLNAIQI